MNAAFSAISGYRSGCARLYCIIAISPGDTAPWLMLIGAFAGAAAGFYSMFRVLMSEEKRMDDEDKKP